MFWMKNCTIDALQHVLHYPSRRRPSFLQIYFRSFFAIVSAGDTSFIYGNTTATIKDRLLTNINVTVRIEIQEVKTFEGQLFSSS